MMRDGRILAALAVLVVLVVLGVAGMLIYLGGPSGPDYPTPEEIAANWPSFRGPGGQGVAAGATAPLEWNGNSGDGVLWKVAVPLKGASSPVSWGLRVFVTGGDAKTREVYCFDAGSGALLWKRPVEGIARSTDEAPEVWDDKTFAAATQATDGRRVYSAFANGDLICHDVDGNEVWKKSLQPIENNYGHASSLTLYRGRLLVLLDQAYGEGGTPQSKLAALDAATGEVAWETARPVRDSWTTPVVISAGGSDQIITAAEPWVIAYAPSTGAEIWKVNCLKGDAVPSPVLAGGLVCAVMEGSDLTAIRPDGSGDVTKTHVAWASEGDFPSISSPVTDGERLYLISSAGMMSCWDAAAGKMLWEEDLEMAVVSSPTLVADRIYIMGGEGDGMVVKAAAKYELLARNLLGEPCQTSPAFAAGRIYIRGEKHLFCIGLK